MRVYWRTGLKYGLMLGAFFAFVVLGTTYLEPAMMLHDMPRAIQERARVPAAPPWITPVMGALLWGGCLAILFYANREMNQRHGFRYLNTAATFLLAFVVVAFTDIVIIDWLIVATLTPSFIVLPGTEGMREYKDYAFSLKPAQLRGAPLLVLFSLVGAAAFNVKRLRNGRRKDGASIHTGPAPRP